MTWHDEDEEPKRVVVKGPKTRGTTAQRVGGWIAVFIVAVVLWMILLGVIWATKAVL